MARSKLSPPWQIYYTELTLLFDEDPDIQIIYDEDEQEIKLYVENPDKADALSMILPKEKKFSNVTLKIIIIPGNGVVESQASLFERAFAGNPVLSYVRTSTGLFEMTYVVFVHEVVQYFNDSIGDVNGMCSTLYQQIAKDVIGEYKGVYFCTDVLGEDGLSLGKPLKELK